MDLVCYLQLASSNLVQQGKLETNLLRQAPSSTCHLQLASPPARPLPPAELTDKLEMAVAVVGRVVIKQGNVADLNDTATGFFISESGAFVTCWHVAGWDKVLGLTVMTRDGSVFPVREVLAVNTNYDLAILQVEGQGFTPLPVAPSPRQGSPVWVLGHPLPWYYMLTAGIVSGYYISHIHEHTWTTMDITADFGNGSSGSPVVNEYGAVVGIAAFKQKTGVPGPAEIVTKSCATSSALLEMIKPESSP
jgi:S1-C subfamily serine protease